MYYSKTTPNKKFGATMYMVEQTLMVLFKLKPYFYSKKESEANGVELDREVYRRSSSLIKIFNAMKKRFPEDVVVAAFEGLNHKQKKKLCELAKWNNNTGRIIATLTLYCQDEEDRRKRLAQPKDTTEVKKIEFEPVQDVREEVAVIKTKKKTLWDLMKEEE